MKNTNKLNEFKSLINDDPDFNYEDTIQDFLEWLEDTDK